ncbi:MAG: prepilin peptidase [Bacteriovoracaceae bacterium]|nr:prepilin peptidase [Bacteriovoracaceae bacterium]
MIEQTLTSKWFFLFLGLLVGSFLNVIIYRLPRNIDWIFKRSHCPHCQALIPIYCNVPLISFILIRGCCLQCKNKISLRYPLVEFITGVAFFLLSPEYFQSTSHPVIQSLLALSIVSILISHFFIDLEHFLLLDRLNMILLGLIAVEFLFFSHQSITWHVVGGLTGFLVPFLISWIYLKLKNRIGLGGGDIKILGILGLSLGAQKIMETLFLSSTLGILFGLPYLLWNQNKKSLLARPIPFGPAIILTYALQKYTSLNMGNFFGF